MYHINEPHVTIQIQLCCKQHSHSLFNWLHGRLNIIIWNNLKMHFKLFAILLVVFGEVSMCGGSLVVDKGERQSFYWCSFGKYGYVFIISEVI